MYVIKDIFGILVIAVKCSSCIFYVLLFSIFFTINVGIATYSAYYKYMNGNKENASKYDCVYQANNS